MKGRVRWKQPNSVIVEMDWRYDDYRREMSVLEYNDYNIKVHFNWLVKVIKQTFRNGRRNYPIYPQSFHIDEGKRIIKDKEWKMVGNTKLLMDVEDEKIDKHNKKVSIKEEGNRRIRNLVNGKKQKNKLSTLIRISDFPNYHFKGNFEDWMQNKWYIEKVIFQYREIEPTYGGETVSWKDILHMESMTFSSLLDLTYYIFEKCGVWCKYSFHKALEKHYKPIKEKYQHTDMKHFDLIIKKLGEDYISYLNRIKREKEKRNEWNEEFEELFNEITKNNL